MKKQLKMLVWGLITLIATGCNTSGQQKSDKVSTTVQVVGAMKNVMMKGELYGTINLDTLSNKEHLYGLGPVEYLTGEILIVDGKSYKGSVVNGSMMSVQETFNLSATFLVYANVDKWKEQNLPDDVKTLKQLETYLDEVTKTAKRPFAFKLMGTVESAGIHLVNLPKGSDVHSPEDAHVGEVKFKLANEKVQLVGFFSTEHKAVFTHHDTFIHVHLITSDRKKMGHLDEVNFKKGAMKLYLPVE